MATFISLMNFTDQGLRNVKESPDRAEAARARNEKLGVTWRGFWYTLGLYDMVVVGEGTEEACLSADLKGLMAGNVRTHTLRAYTIDEMRRFLKNAV